MTEQERAPVAERIADYLAAFWPALPSKHIRMNAGGPKYSWVKNDEDRHVALSHTDLVAHAAGEQTIGAHLHDMAGRCRTGMLDIDQGGRTAIVAALGAAHTLNYTAYGIYYPAGQGAGAEHDGGRLVVHFADFADWRAIRAVMDQIRAADGLPEDTEIWPGGGNAVALPLGVHIRKGTRGELLTQAAEIVALDTPDGLAAGLDLVLSLPLNGAPPNIVDIIKEVQPEPKPIKLIAMPAGRATLASVKAQFNAEHTLAQLLIDYGATETRDGYTCPCGVPHTHPTTLYISQKGKLFSFSPRCHWHTTKGWDAFGLYVLVEHGDNVTAALKALNPIAPRKRRRREDPPLAEPQIRQQTPAQAHDAERKREAWTKEATAIRENVSRQAETDERLTPCDRDTLCEMLGWAAAHHAVSCWLGRATLARLAGYSLGSVKRSVMHLEKLGYFESSGIGGRSIDTARRNFSRGSLFAQNDPRIDLESIDLYNLGACEPRAAAPEPERPAAPETLDEWEACEPDECDDSVLAWLYDQERHAAQPPVEVEPAPIRVRWSGPRCHATDGKRFTGWYTNADDAMAEAQGWTEKAEHVPQSDTPGASYDPALCVLQDGAYTGGVKRYADLVTRQRWANALIRPREQPPGTVNLLAGDPDDGDPLVRCAPVEPIAAAEYWKLKNKKAVSSKQAVWIARRLAELEIWRPASEVAEMPAPGGRRVRFAHKPQPVTVEGQGRALTSSRAAGPPVAQQQAPLFAGP